MKKLEDDLRDQLKLEAPLAVQGRGEHAGFFPLNKFTADPADPNEKFRGRKKSEDADSGFIGLQVHTGTVAFANIRIRT